MNREQRQQRIVEIEAEMRRLFRLPMVNFEIVLSYNRLEKQWKILNGYEEKKHNPLRFDPNGVLLENQLRTPHGNKKK